MATLCGCGAITGKDGRCSKPGCTFSSKAKSSKLANFVVYSSTDEETWIPVKAEDVPAFCKEPEVMGMMAKGFAAKHEESNTWYIAEKVDG